MNITIIKPIVKNIPEETRPHCPYCKSSIVVKHGKRIRGIKDLNIKEVIVQRWKCRSCGKTFTQRPVGVSRRQSSNLVVSISIFMYTMGLSYDNAAKALSIIDIKLSKTTIWRYVKDLGTKLKQKRLYRERYEIVGFDQTYMKVKGKKKAINMIFSKEGELLDVRILEDEKSNTFRREILRLKEKLKVEVIVTDDHSSYPESLIDTGVERQLCLVHLLKNLSKSLKESTFTQEEKELIMSLARAPTYKGGEVIWEMYKDRVKVKGSRDKGVVILLRLTEKWRDLTVYERREDVPKDNNFTERSIGRTKNRYKTTRGMKSEEGLISFIYVTQEIWRMNEIGEINLVKLMA